MTAFPTEIPELDTRVLLELDDSTLAATCILNKYFNQLHSNDHFWYQRLVSKGYGGLISLKHQGLFLTSRGLYTKLVTGASYVVIFDDKPCTYSNINDAYQAFIVWLAQLSEIKISDMPPIERASEIGNIVRNTQRSFGIEIYILFDDIETHIGDERFLLLGVNTITNYNVGQLVGNVKFTINPKLDLSQMLTLNKSNTYVFYMPDLEIGIFDVNKIILVQKIDTVEKNNQTMANLVQYMNDEGFNNTEFIVIKVDDQVTRRKLQRVFFYRKANQFISYELPGIIIDTIDNNFCMVTLPSSIYKHLMYIYVEGIDVGDSKTIIDPSSLTDLLPQIYPTLNWEPIKHITNYPLDPDYLKTLV